jgi:hypothetical protein
VIKRWSCEEDLLLKVMQSLVLEECTYKEGGDTYNVFVLRTSRLHSPL